MKYRKFSWGQFFISVIIPTVMVFGVVFGNRAITVINETSLEGDRAIFIIDAGHGGSDGGAVSCTGIHESALNLQIACRLNDLMQLLGMHTIMIRTDDNSVETQGTTLAQKKASDLKSRVRIVNNTPNAILISIHQNIFPDSQYSGAQVFYAPNFESEVLAKKLQEQLIYSINPGSKRQCKQANGIYLMENIKSTGVLIECGFLSNPAEEYLLRTQQYQKKLCCVISATVSKYLVQRTIS